MFLLFSEIGSERAEAIFVFFVFSVFLLTNGSDCDKITSLFMRGYFMVNLDSIDIQILSLLKENARIKASQISEIVNLSVSSVAERIRKLEKSGVITSYTTVIDQKKIGNNVTALMEVSLEHPKYYDAFTEMIQNTRSVVSCYYISGDFDFMLKVLAPSEKLEEIHRIIKSFPGVSGTRTNVVLKSIKTGQTLLPEEI